jgi:hypothetical protein
MLEYRLPGFNAACVGRSVNEQMPRLTASLGTAFWNLCAPADRQPWRRAFQWFVGRRAHLRARHFVCTLLTSSKKEYSMNRIVYLVGAVVIIIALLSFFGLR